MNVLEKGAYKHPVTPEWVAAVRAELERRGRGAQAELQKFLGCGSNELAALWNGQQTSELVPRINEFLGWDTVTLPPIAKSETSAAKKIDQLDADAMASMDRYLDLLNSQDPTERALARALLDGVIKTILDRSATK